jgi:acyl-CoA synthetase (AMP-forming)/AMP-acid ligase II
MDTFIDLLRTRAQKEPDVCAFAFLASDGAETRLTYAQLDQRARALAAVLQRSGAAGERVLIALEPGLDYVIALFGCLLAGSTMVPCAPFRRADRAAQLRAIEIDSGAKLAIGCAPVSEDLEFPDIKWIAMDSASADEADCWCEPVLDGDAIALLQYTSGSTASPRGVMVSHANLIANAGCIKEGFQHPKGVWGVTWLPPYHDMGLIGGILQPIYFDAPSAVISPLEFVRRPIIWLEAVTRYRASITGGPNFAYELCASTVTPAEMRTLDLDCLKLAYIGAEPVRAETLERFTAKFAGVGFRKEAFFPCYGLAEATLYVSGGRPSISYLSGSALSEHRVVDKSGNDHDNDTRVIVGCGRPASALKVSIVNPETELPSTAGSIGEIWVSGPSIAKGYWNRSDDTRSTFQARLAGNHEQPYLRTGDLGFLRNGELFITGRSKDLIIVRGRNHYPQDIEHTVARVSRAVRPGTCAAFSVDSGSEEKLVLIVEIPRPRPEQIDVFTGDIRQAVAAAHEVQPSVIVLVRPGVIPVTSSGKVRRLECREQYIAGAFRGLTV